MKIKASIVTNSVLAILIAAGVSACNQNKPETKAAAAPTAGTTASNPEIVYINQDSLVAKYDYIKDMDKRTRDYTELGNGSIDYTKILPYADKAGLEYYFIEQGGNFARNSMDSIASSAKFFQEHLQNLL